MPQRYVVMSYIQNPEEIGFDKGVLCNDFFTPVGWHSFSVRIPCVRPTATKYLNVSTGDDLQDLVVCDVIVKASPIGKHV